MGVKDKFVGILVEKLPWVVKDQRFWNPDYCSQLNSESLLPAHIKDADKLSMLGNLAVGHQEIK